MQIKLQSIYAETLVDVEKADYMVKIDYMVWCDNCTIHLIREMYGSDADGHRGVNKLWIEDTHVNIEDIKFEIGFPKDKLPEAKKALEEALYKHDYFDEL